jgi:hypothetical protein
LINRDISDGRQSGVRGTPASFVNGKRLNNRSLAGFQQAIDGELKKCSRLTAEFAENAEKDIKESNCLNYNFNFNIRLVQLGLTNIA